MGGLIEVFGVEVNAMDAILYVWFALVILSVAYVSWDNFIRGNPEEAVMKWGWLLITLYMGPIALALYVMADKEPCQVNMPSSSSLCGNRESDRLSTALPVTPPESSRRPRSRRLLGSRCGAI
jgi:hypothetical protein